MTAFPAAVISALLLLTSTNASADSIDLYGYAGREPAAGSLIYSRARYYDPAAGRFTQRDPIGLAGGLNEYAYVGGNPVYARDPGGTDPREPGDVADRPYWDAMVGLAEAGGATRNDPIVQGYSKYGGLVIPGVLGALAAPNAALQVFGGAALDFGVRAGTYAVFGQPGIDYLYRPQSDPFAPQLLRGEILPFGKFTPTLVDPYIDAKLAEFAAAGRMKEFLLGQDQRGLVAPVARALGYTEALELWPANMNFRAQLVNGALPPYLERASIQFNEHMIERLFNAGYNFSTIHPPPAPITSLWYQAEVDLLMIEKGVVPTYINPAPYLH